VNSPGDSGRQPAIKATAKGYSPTLEPGLSRLFEKVNETVNKTCEVRAKP
jgi:hypothetical protein